MGFPNRCAIVARCGRVVQTFLSELGVSNFEALSAGLTPGAQVHATSIIEHETARTKVLALPSLIAVSSGDLADKQICMLADAMRSHGRYADLTSCIDRIPSEQLDLIYDACTGFNIPCINFKDSNDRSPILPTQESAARVTRFWREKSRPPSAALLFLDSDGSSAVELSLAECAAVLASATDFGVTQLTELFERLGPHLCRHSSKEGVAELEQAIAFTFEVYR